MANAFKKIQGNFSETSRQRIDGRIGQPVNQNFKTKRTEFVKFVRKTSLYYLHITEAVTIKFSVFPSKTH